ncbi:hypothetical protein DCAR_0623823 [Daucus carota subsp. sativus]|uniref:Dirigent protein n=1 Tax=Daucus carota subsp. sativus TaxID=79200 RepID=A0A161ZU73_DAUCS|nr:hypothetical protein DCAR_0623823 [Daucus carota subsp. sativus]
MPVVGGSGMFRFSHGYAMAKTFRSDQKVAVVVYDDCMNPLIAPSHPAQSTLHANDKTVSSLEPISVIYLVPFNLVSLEQHQLKKLGNF